MGSQSHTNFFLSSWSFKVCLGETQVEWPTKLALEQLLGLFSFQILSISNIRVNRQVKKEKRLLIARNGFNLKNKLLTQTTIEKDQDLPAPMA